MRHFPFLLAMLFTFTVTPSWLPSPLASGKCETYEDDCGVDPVDPEDPQRPGDPGNPDDPGELFNRA